MRSYEETGKSVDEAVANGLRRLGLERDEVTVHVITEGRAGILGLGSEPARVRIDIPDPGEPLTGGPNVEPTAELVEEVDDEDAAEAVEDEEEEYEEIDLDEVADVAQTIVERILDALQIDALVEVRDTPADLIETGSPELTVDIAGRDLGALIGRRGETLSALQFIVNLVLARKMEQRVNVLVDIEGYRVRRERSLRGLATRMAERVAANHQAITLEAMPPAERRIVHLTLAEHPAVHTFSTGVGDDRKVVIAPK